MKDLKKIVPSFEGKKVLVLGDIMLDEHIWSNVSRISPEAPVPVADVKEITHVPGGCGNVAANIKALGGVPFLCGVIGSDSSADKLGGALKKLGISSENIIRSSERPTILKSRIIASSQQVVRVDREDRGTLSSSLEKRILAQVERLASKMDAIILSDYNKGLLSEKICRRAIALAIKHKKPLAVDPKGADYSKYHGATVITPNLLEAEIASALKIINDTALVQAGSRLLINTKAVNIIITRGKDGMSVFTRGAKPFHIDAVPREVFDITGAGDTVIATLSLALACGASVSDSALLSNYAASIAVSKIGTQPVFKDELEVALEEKEPMGQKIKSRGDLKKICKILRQRGVRIVFTNGCFDILHLGHVRYLKEAKKLGDVLIIGLNSDSSVKKIKDKDRPYVSELERAEILASLECVDYVSIFSETRPDPLIRVIRPDVHVKGGDYKISQLPERKMAEKLGARVVVIPPVKGRSTTTLIKKIMGREK